VSGGALRWPSLLRPVVGAPEADEVAFDEYAAAFAAQTGVFAAGAMVLFTLVWWVLDVAVLPDVRHVEGFARLRLRALAVEGGTLVLFLTSAAARRRALSLAPGLYAALMGSFGFSLGQIGGADLTLLADAFIGVIPAALLPLRLGPRVLWTAVIGAALGAGFAAGFPGPRAPPLAQAEVSFLVFAMILSVTIGELSFRVTRQAFFKALDLERSNASLDVLTRSLSATVAERTKELRELAQHLATAQEAERGRIARELHDDLGQNLTAMRFTLARIEGVEGSRAADLLSDLSALLDGTSASVRSFVTALRPRVLDDLGPIAACTWLCERIRSTTEIACDLGATDAARGQAARLDPELALALFRFVQEGTTNALKHGGPRRIEVRIEVEGGRLLARVRDDGCGFDPDRSRGGFGLLGLRERLRSSGGELRVRSSVGHGAVLEAFFPIEDHGGGVEREG
jgi:signal transduction histidine kinase